ncbi:MAG TPA: YicC family protein [Firmicutes bacterium]|nr:YicC family protein [Bacillota bacterium]
MVRSMTGFGRGEAVGRRYRVTVEVRTVNHRFLDTAIRLPKAATALEERARALVATRLKRGRVEVFANLEEVGDEPRPVRVDLPLARGYREALEGLRTSLGLAGEVTLAMLLDMPGVVTAEEAIDPEALWPVLEEALTAALDEVVHLRETEGERLAGDLEKRLAVVGREIEAIAERAPAVSEEYRARLQERVQEILGETPVDEGRLLQEVALLADRVSITEELVRLRSHLTEAASTLAGTEAAVGRKFDFLLQEMNREINTIGAKASDVQIARGVIAVKAELEKIREQVQNIE